MISPSTITSKRYPQSSFYFFVNDGQRLLLLNLKAKLRELKHKARLIG